MKHRDELEYLEGELRAYRYIVNKCWEHEQKIEEASAAKLGISSPGIKEVIYENVGDPYHDNTNELNAVIEYNEKWLLYWQFRRKWIEKRLDVLSEEEYKIIKYRYMMQTKATYAWIADIISCHENTVKPMIERILRKMMKVCV